ncbi:C-type lectin domain family 4 member G-like [Mercenaria mercenaria]|uniref:C-type lectin domain family 4 member G-like n=1 Tax=Mercenaria mercenaria TaxID=6596 RepID=UPI00234F0EC3|nr:C-type lectin domain family 4 member G-like [Mercenaria mercenaria]
MGYIEMRHYKEINLIAIPDQNSTSPQCPDMWIPFKGFCYLFVDEQYTFDDAKHMKGVFYWIGLTDIDEEGIFKWYDTDEVASFTDWGPSRPNNGLGKQDCGFIHPGLDFKWDDYDCGTRQKSVCEKTAK